MIPKKEKYIYKLMCKVVEDMINEEVREIAMRMLENGNLSLEEIAEYTGLSEDEIKSFSDE